MTIKRRMRNAGNAIYDIGGLKKSGCRAAYLALLGRRT
jgi:hypothetical protein